MSIKKLSLYICYIFWLQYVLVMRNLVLYFQALAIRIKHFIYIINYKRFVHFRDFYTFCQNVNFKCL